MMVTAIRPKAVDPLEAINKFNDQVANNYTGVKKVGGNSIEYMDPRQKEMFYGTLAQQEPIRRGMVDKMLSTNPDIKSYLPDVIEFAKQKGADNKTISNFYQKATQAISTGYEKAVIGDPLFQNYAVNKWGVENLKPMIAPDKPPKPIKTEEVTQAELDRVPYKIYEGPNGKIIEMKKPAVILDEDGNEMSIDRIVGDKAYGIKNVPERTGLAGEIINGKDVEGDIIKAKKEEVTVPISQIADKLYREAPWLNQVIPYKQNPQQPKAVPQAPGQAWKNYQDDKMKSQTTKFKDLGKIYSIPNSEVESFLKDHPNAQKL
jgi:hypothetical protein